MHRRPLVPFDQSFGGKALLDGPGADSVPKWADRKPPKRGIAARKEWAPRSS